MIKARELILRMDPEERENYRKGYLKELKGNLINAGIGVCITVIVILIALIFANRYEAIDDAGTFFFCGYMSGIGILTLIILWLSYGRVSEEYGPATDEELKELERLQ